MARDPLFDLFQARLRRLLPQAGPYTETVYRSCTPKYAVEADLISGAGSRKFGGRWNPPGIAVVYASLTPETALAEALAHHRYYAIPIEDAMPRTFVAIAVRLQAVLDLRAGTVRRRLRLSQERLMTVDWRSEERSGREAMTQTLGSAAFAIGLEGLIVPSAAAPSGHNLLIFPQNLQAGSCLRVLAPERLAPP